MKSTDLLPVLRELPGGETGQRMSFREIITGLVNTDRAMYAAEFASAVSFGIWAFPPGVNVGDDLREAHRPMRGPSREKRGRPGSILMMLSTTPKHITMLS